MNAFAGVWTALITPFNEDGTIDWVAYKRLIHQQRAAGVAGVVPCGTTGESPTLTDEEKKQLILAAIQELKGSGVKVMAGTGSNDTHYTVELSRWASQAGADSLLIVSPYYNKPTQSGLIAHFKSVADAVQCPVVVYNVPGRSGVSITPDTLVELASHPRIQAVKEASGDVSLTSEIIDKMAEKGRKMEVLSGDDLTFLPASSVGAIGVISVASNLIPVEMVAFAQAIQKREWLKAQQLHQHWYPLFRDLFVETNPGPTKAAFALLGRSTGKLRPPLTEMAPTSVNKLRATLVRVGLV